MIFAAIFVSLQLMLRDSARSPQVQDLEAQRFSLSMCTCDPLVLTFVVNSLAATAGTRALAVNQ